MFNYLRKSKAKKTLTGTLGGVSVYFNVDYTWLRIAFVLLVLLTKGALIILYIALMLLMKEEAKGVKISITKKAAVYVKYTWKHLKSILTDPKYGKLFAFCFLILGGLWRASEEGYIPVVLIILGAMLFILSFQKKNNLGEKGKIYKYNRPISHRIN